jgi:hypothetical protein
MPGLRSEQEILKAFENIERVPGSKQKRKESTPVADKKRKQAFGESNGWDEEPIIKILNGEETELFKVSALAQAIDKQVVTIRHWEKKGYLPQAPFRLRSKNLNGQKVNGNRVYTRELIQIVIEEFANRGLLSTARVEWKNHEDLPRIIAKRWKDSLENAGRKTTN